MEGSLNSKKVITITIITVKLFGFFPKMHLFNIYSKLKTIFQGINIERHKTYQNRNI